MVSEAQDMLVLAARILVELKIPAHTAQYATILGDLASLFPKNDSRGILAARRDLLLHDDQGILVAYLVDSLRRYPEGEHPPESRSPDYWEKLAVSRFPTETALPRFALSIDRPPESLRQLVSAGMASDRPNAGHLAHQALLAYVIPLSQKHRRRITTDLSACLGGTTVFRHRFINVLAESRLARLLGVVGPIVLLFVIVALIWSIEVAFTVFLIVFISLIYLWGVILAFITFVYEKVDSFLEELPGKKDLRVSAAALEAAMRELVRGKQRVLTDLSIRPVPSEWIEFALDSVVAADHELFHEALSIIGSVEASDPVRSRLASWLSRINLEWDNPASGRSGLRVQAPSDDGRN